MFYEKTFMKKKTLYGNIPEEARFNANFIKKQVSCPIILLMDLYLTKLM